MYRHGRIYCNAQLFQIIGNTGQISRNGGGGHPPGQRGIAAESFNIYKVSPAADGLAQQNTSHSHIRHRKEFDPAQFAGSYSGDQGADHPAINCNTTMPNLKDFVQMAAIIFPTKQYIVKPRSNDTAYGTDHNHIDCAVCVDAKHLASPDGIKGACQKSSCNQNPIPVYRKWTNGESDPG